MSIVYVCRRLVFSYQPIVTSYLVVALGLPGRPLLFGSRSLSEETPEVAFCSPWHTHFTCSPEDFVANFSRKTRPKVTGEELW